MALCEKMMEEVVEDIGGMEGLGEVYHDWALLRSVEHSYTLSTLLGGVSKLPTTFDWLAYRDNDDDTAAADDHDAPAAPAASAAAAGMSPDSNVSRQAHDEIPHGGQHLDDVNAQDGWVHARVAVARKRDKGVSQGARKGGSSSGSSSSGLASGRASSASGQQTQAMVAQTSARTALGGRRKGGSARKTREISFCDVEGGGEGSGGACGEESRATICLDVHTLVENIEAGGWSNKVDKTGKRKNAGKGRAVKVVGGPASATGALEAGGGVLPLQAIEQACLRRGHLVPHVLPVICCRMCKASGHEYPHVLQAPKHLRSRRALLALEQACASCCSAP